MSAFADLQKKEEAAQIRKTCVNSTFSEFKIGEVIYAPNDATFFCKNSLSETTPCSCSTELFIEVHRRVPDEFRKKTDNEALKDVKNLNLSIHRFKLPHYAQDTYDRYIKNGKIILESNAYKTSLSIESLPVDGSFYVGRLSKDYGVFIATDPKAKTPQGNPVTFYCEFRDAVIDKYKCRTDIAFDKERAFGVFDIYSEYVSKENFLELYEYALTEHAKMISNNKHD